VNEWRKSRWFEHTTYDDKPTATSDHLVSLITWICQMVEHKYSTVSQVDHSVYEIDRCFVDQETTNSWPYAENLSNICHESSTYQDLCSDSMPSVEYISRLVLRVTDRSQTRWNIKNSYTQTNTATTNDFINPFLNSLATRTAYAWISWYGCWLIDHT
jgi:hypothetical protein